MAPRVRAASPEEVDRAIDKAKQYLYSQLKESGHWETDDKRQTVKHDDWHKMQGDSYGGWTALAVYALLASGENPQDPRIQKAVEFLEKTDIMGIYSVGIRAQVWPLLPDSATIKSMSHRDAKLILDGMNTGKQNPQNKGFWDYGNGKGEKLTGSGKLDHSVSQFGILGLWACAKNGVEIDTKDWKVFEEGWRSHQFPDGGWEYEGTPSKPDPRAQKEAQRAESLSMTAAGVASLFIINDFLHSDDGINCRGNIPDEHIDKGLAWISQHFPAFIKDQYDKKKGIDCYTLYGIERIGVASGYKYFGTTDWYAEGADALIKTQKANGSWTGSFFGSNMALPWTSFGMIFLSRGRAPVMMNKLQYDVVDAGGKSIEANWNQRPRDVANVARWTGDQIERVLNFQIVNLKVSVDELHDAPILYIAGDQQLKFTDEEIGKLRQYVEGGGMIFGNADCGLAKPLFAKSFEELGKKLFPKYAFRDLPASNLIFTGQIFQRSKWSEKPTIRAMSNGVRELMVIFPDSDPARAWQTHAEKTKEEMYQATADLFLYAVDKSNLRNKGDSYIIRPDAKISADQTAKIARIIVGDNPDPEPGGWRRIAALLHNKFKSDVTIENVRLGQDRLSGFKLAHLTGTSHFKLTDAQRTALVDFAIRGGTLVIDAAGGSDDFATSAEAELRTAFGDAATKGLADPLDIESPVYELPKARIDAVSYRDFYKSKVASKLKAPRVYGIMRGDRIAVFYSREDLSAGMVGEPVDGIYGYSPQSATDLMRNIVLYGAFAARPASTAAAASH
ncbi:MAG TPA: DUF4159 domain-containing protein [Humisphaera sp.]|nr:DUF4159 domain-containing protein [Humisphaera sp.]